MNDEIRVLIFIVVSIIIAFCLIGYYNMTSDGQDDTIGD